MRTSYVRCIKLKHQKGKKVDLAQNTKRMKKEGYRSHPICIKYKTTCSIARLTSVILQMNVATTYQLKKMVIVQNFKNLMFKAMCNSHQHLYLRKTKGHIQGLLQSNKGWRYKKHFKVVFQSLRFSMHKLVVMDLWFWY